MSKGKIAFILLMVFNFIVLVFLVDFDGSAEDEGYKQELSKLRDENLQLKSINSKLDLEILELTTFNDRIISELKIEKEITTLIKRERDEKLDDIDGMDNSELYGFFSNFKTEGVNSQSGY